MGHSLQAVRWSAKGRVGGVEVTKELTAGPLCREVLQEVFKILPLQTTPAASEDGTTGRRGGRPHGYQQWDAGLGPTRLETGLDAPAWQQAISKTLPSAEQLEKRYDDALGCGRTSQEAPCSRRTCSFCWRNRGQGIVRQTVVVFNHWGQAPAEVSAEIGTIRGGPVKDAGTPTWVRSAASRGSDVEIYLKAEDQRAGNRGLGRTTLGKVAYFFEHQGNDWRRGESSNAIPEGEFTIWVAVAEYVTAGVGNKRKVDPVTGLDMFRMRTSLTFFPASAIRCVVHMMHACSTTGTSACRLVDEGSKRPVWRCNLTGNPNYLLNKYFHSVLRDSIA